MSEWNDLERRAFAGAMAWHWGLCGFLVLVAGMEFVWAMWG